MRTCISLRATGARPLPSQFTGPDVRYDASLVECFLSEFTKEGDIVFDPFAGFGTT